MALLLVYLSTTLRRDVISTLTTDARPASLAINVTRLGKFLERFEGLLVVEIFLNLLVQK